MKLCWHDWHVHKRGEKSLRWKILQDERVSGVLLALACTTALFISLAEISSSIITSIPVSLTHEIFVPIACVIYFAVYFLAIIFVDIESDPWANQDKTCIKCNAISFDATKENERAEKRDAIWLVKKEKRDAVVAKIDKRYAQWIALKK